MLNPPDTPNEKRLGELTLSNMGGMASAEWKSVMGKDIFVITKHSATLPPSKTIAQLITSSWWLRIVC